MGNKPVALDIKYKFGGRKVVELPVPFVSKSAKTGEVVCDPIGRFEDLESGYKLLELSGKDGPFELVQEIYGKDDPVTKEVVEEAKEVLKEVIEVDKPKRRFGRPPGRPKKAVPASQED